MKRHPLHVEVAAENLDAAVEEALAQLNCSRAEADIEVLQAHSSGVLGFFGKRPARVRAELHDRGVIARQFTAQFLVLGGFDAEVELKPSLHQLELNLKTENPSLLIGRHGQTLDALQSLVGTMTDRLTTDRSPVVLDVDGYRRRRQAFLKRLARRLSGKVRQTGKPVSAPPLATSERRILHELFKQEQDLESNSRAFEGDRKVVVLRLRG